MHPEQPPPASRSGVQDPHHRPSVAHASIYGEQYSPGQTTAGHTARKGHTPTAGQRSHLRERSAPTNSGRAAQDASQTQDSKVPNKHSDRT